jgi:predicted transcriptional regulator/DNA-binding XRE family transcriptional regulator
MATRKALLGNKIRRLRQDRNLTQQGMAERLGISPSYLNLIEHDERPVTVALLLKLGQVFDVDLQELSDDVERRLALALREVFADPGLGATEIDLEEIRRLVTAAPKAGRAIADLYRAWRTAREDAQSLTLGLPSGTTKRIVLPTEEARDFFESRANHFAAVEDAAEKLWSGAELSGADLERGLMARLSSRHGITINVAPVEMMNGALRRFDSRARTLTIAEVLPRPSRGFQFAYQLGLLEARAVIDSAIQAAKLSSSESETLCRVGLANYFAGAVLMPYAAFLAAARTARYDIETLMHRFGVSFEQVCHRFSTLQRPGETGVPFFFARADTAGNVTKRFSAAGFHFSRFGGSCPRLVLHEAFATPELIRTQVARLPDGATFFCVARTIERPGGGFHAPSSRYAVSIGCDISRAPELVYADGLNLERVETAAEIGVGCRLCERQNCRQRAFPPLQHRLLVDEQVKGASAYSFDTRR